MRFLLQGRFTHEGRNARSARKPDVLRPDSGASAASFPRKAARPGIDDRPVRHQVGQPRVRGNNTNKVSRVWRPLLSYTGRDAFFLLGKTRRKNGGRIHAGRVTADRLHGLLAIMKQTGMDVHSFTVNDSVAIIRVHIRQNKYEEAITCLLEASKGLSVDIS